MSGEGSVTQQANNQNQQNQNQANQIAKKVKKQIGLTAVGGLGGPNQGFIAGNLEGQDKLYYGQEAAEAAKKEMANAGLGTYNETTGSFQNVVKDPKTGKMKIVNTGATMGAAMGTGEGTVMGQLPISKAMFEQQKKLQMIATGAMALTGIPLVGAAFMDYNSKKYSDYINKFNNTLQSSTSIAAQPTTQTQSNQRITDTKATAETGESSFVETEAERAKRMAAISRRSEALKGKRSFFSGVKQTIAGQL